MLFHSMTGARAERIEYLLMHEFHRYKFILPEKKAFGDNHASSNNKTAEVIEGDADDEGNYPSMCLNCDD